MYNPYKQFDLLYKEFLKQEQEEFVFFESKDLKIQKRLPKIKHENNKPPAHFHLLKRHVYFSNQAIIKLLSNLGAKGTYNAINYIIRNSEAGYAINEYGKQVSTKEIMEEWKQNFSDRKNSKEAWHLCFSIKDNGEQSIKFLQKSVSEVLQKHFFAHKYIQVLHTHQNNPHIHVIINKRNILTQKKIHFKEKDDIKNFFNEMRDDFAFSLGNKGLNYHNGYKYEKRDILDRVEFLNELDDKFNYRDTALQLKKDRENLETKNNNFKHKKLTLEREIVLIKRENDNLFKELKELNKIHCIHSELNKYNYAMKYEKKSKKTQAKILANYKYLTQDLIDNPPEFNAERLDFVLDKFKSNRNLLTQHFNDLKVINKELNILRKSMNEVGFAYTKHNNTFSKEIKNKAMNTQAKQHYLDFVMNNKKLITKKQFSIAQDIKKELNHNQQVIQKHISMQHEIDSIMLQYFNIKSTSNSLLYARKDIDKKLESLKFMNKENIVDEKLYNRYVKTLESNAIMIDKSINEKLTYYHEFFQNEAELSKYHIKTLKYFQKEFISLANYSMNEKAISIDSNKTMDKTITERLHAYIEKREQKLHSLQESLERENYYKDFVEWYVKDRNSDTEFLRDSLAKKIKDNTLESYLDKYDKTALIDYKVYLLRKQEKQNNTNKTIQHNSHLNTNRGMER